MTEERQPNTERYAPTPKCPLGDHLVFVWDNGEIVPHYGNHGIKCPASNTLHPNVTTKPKEPNTELRAETLRRLIADDSVSWHQTVAQAYDAGRASVQVEANGLIDELKSKATGLADASGFNVTYDVPVGILHRLLAWRDGAAIRRPGETKTQTVEAPNTELRERAREWLALHSRPYLPWTLGESEKEAVVHLIAAFATSMSQNLKEDKDDWKAIADSRQCRLRAAEKQLAEALKERDELAAQVNHDCAFHDELALTNGIHNRFCGENGEPCQVCRLKAEREEKKS